MRATSSSEAASATIAMSATPASAIGARISPARGTSGARSSAPARYATPLPSEGVTGGGFNAATAECIDGVREFLTIHYVASTRNDTPFWRATKEVAVPEALRERLRIWKSRLPNPRSIYRGYHGFESYSWAVMLLGLGYEPTSSLPMLDHLDIARGEAMFEGVKRRANQLLETLPSQFEYLTRQRGLELPGSSATRVRRSTPTASGMRR